MTATLKPTPAYYPIEATKSCVIFGHLRTFISAILYGYLRPKIILLGVAACFEEG